MPDAHAPRVPVGGAVTAPGKPTAVNPAPPAPVGGAGSPVADPTRRPLLWKVLQVIARLLTTLLFDLKVWGARNVPRRGGVLLVSNHQSYLDPVLLGVRLDRPVSYMAKSELFRNRFFAWFIRSLNAFPVRQGAGDKRAMEETIERLRQGYVLTIFPEGSRSEDGELLPIEKGVALVIRRAQVPIVPVVIDGANKAWPKSAKRFRAAPVRVLYGPPMDLSGLARDQIVPTIARTLKEMLAELRRR